MSYTIDVYRNKIKACPNYIDFLSYISFFPQLVAGPIERASHLLPQIQKTKTFTYENGKKGIELLIRGFFYKIVIADNCGYWVEQYYSHLKSQNGLDTILNHILFSFQIYGDFAGYSYIAIGTALFFGIKLNTNFDAPFLSDSVREFWQRWHISFSNWMKDYIYIPLGGNRLGVKRTVFNLLIVFVMSGLWHGAGLNFLIWGFLHFLFVAILPFEKIKISNYIKIPLTFFIISIVWIPFRSPNIETTISIFSKLIYFQNWTSLSSIPVLHICLALSMLTFEILERKTNYLAQLYQIKWARISFYYLCIFLIFFFIRRESNFIYFEF